MKSILKGLHNGWVRLGLYLTIIPILMLIFFYKPTELFVTWLLMDFIKNILINAYQKGTLTGLVLSFISAISTIITTIVIAIVKIKKLFKEKDASDGDT